MEWGIHTAHAFFPQLYFMPNSLIYIIRCCFIDLSHLQLCWKNYSLCYFTWCLSFILCFLCVSLLNYAFHFRVSPQCVCFHEMSHVVIWVSVMMMLSDCLCSVLGAVLVCCSQSWDSFLCRTCTSLTGYWFHCHCMKQLTNQITLPTDASDASWAQTTSQRNIAQVVKWKYLRFKITAYH